MHENACSERRTEFAERQKAPTDRVRDDYGHLRQQGALGTKTLPRRGRGHQLRPRHRTLDYEGRRRSLVLFYAAVQLCIFAHCQESAWRIGRSAWIAVITALNVDDPIILKR